MRNDGEGGQRKRQAGRIMDCEGEEQNRLGGDRGDEEEGESTSPVLSAWKTEPYYFAFQLSLGSLLRQVV